MGNQNNTSAPPVQNSAPPVQSVPEVSSPPLAEAGKVEEVSQADELAQRELDLEEREKAILAREQNAQEQESSLSNLADSLSKKDEKLKSDELALKALGLKLQEIDKQRGAPAPATIVEKSEIEAVFEKLGHIPVVAITKGIYPNCVRRARGDKFKVHDITLYSKTWMKLDK